MEIRILRYFVETAREGNITRAAQRLHVTQPTMSRQLKELEDELGQKLFIRSNYSMRLTEAGMLLRKRAEDILDMVDKTESEFKMLDDTAGGEIFIGCPESDSLRFLYNLELNPEPIIVFITFMVIKSFLFCTPEVCQPKKSQEVCKSLIFLVAVLEEVSFVTVYFE